jgi:8-amino-7-oxononanoate synthase
MTDTSPPTLAQRLGARQRAMRERGLERRLQPRGPSADLVDLAGNDYLALARDPRVVQAAADAAHEWGAGSTGSRLVSGSTTLHSTLEDELAVFTGSESTLLFSSGYLANIGVITALADPGTLIVIDAHAHASLRDAARLSRGRVVVTRHNDVAHVQSELTLSALPRAIVVTESVFSVDGDIAPLVELFDVCSRADATLLIDEAHAIGTVGQGRGLMCELGQRGYEATRVEVVQTGTLSKALGSQGGFVTGPSVLRDFLITHARTFVYDTALAPPSVAAARAAIEIVSAEPGRIASLHDRVGQIATRLDVSPPRGAVISVAVESADRAVEVRKAALDAGVVVGAFRPPSVPDNRSRIRITARSDLRPDDVDRAMSVISGLVVGSS